MNILVAGIPRSGSLRLFNILRIGLQQVYSKDQIHHGYEKKFIPNYNKQVNLNKMHDCLDSKRDWADFVFTTRRDLRYILASGIDFGMLKKHLSEQEIVEFLTDVTTKHSYWKQSTDFEIPYENFEENKREFINNVFSVLNIVVDVDKILIGMAEINQKYLDKNGHLEYFSPKHISKNSHLHFSDRLDQEQVVVIEKHFKNWLISHGYELVIHDPHLLN